MGENNPTDDTAASLDDKILYDTKSAGRIAYITINNPERLNVMDKAMLQRFLELLRHVDQDRKAKVLVIKSTGDRIFSAGFDLRIFKEAGGSTDEARDFLLTHLRGISQAIFFMKKPVVMQLQGPAIGLGCFMSLAADFRIVARKEGVYFQLPELQIGFPGVIGASVNSVAILGLARSKRFILTCDKIGLDELDRWGVITKICEPGDLEVEVKKFCLNLVEKNPVLLCTQKMMCNLMGMEMANKFYDLENDVWEYTFKNTGYDHPDDLNDFLRKSWSKYGHGTPF